MTMKNSFPKCSEIARYWWDKDKTEEVPWNSCIIDWGEPCCFACGEWSWTRNEKNLGKVEAWDSSNLDRAHIIPDSLGGSIEVSNFLLLCKDCHKQAPNTKSPELMFAWVKNKKRNDEFDIYANIQGLGTEEY